jgi:MtN3 and saliva related transmembrane protein
MEWIGYTGLTALAVCWIPQSIDTLRNGRCDVNLGFLILSALGSAALALYAVLRQDTVFTLVNILTTSGALLNLYFKLRPRTAPK